MPTVSESLRQRVGFFADAVIEEFLGKVPLSVKVNQARGAVIRP